MIIDNVKNIQKNIEFACHDSQRTAKNVTLVAVTKMRTTAEAREVYDAGIVHLAENRLEGLIEKQTFFSDVEDIKWHFIGSLQTRKVKDVINRIDYFHALDRLSLAKEIQKRAEHEINCFLQINISGEASKHGFSPNDLSTVVGEMAQFDKIKIIGLMTMAPIDASEDELHEIFGQLRALQVSIAEKKINYAPCTETSMGMTHDYKIAIAEGATFIRVGTALFQ